MRAREAIFESPVSIPVTVRLPVLAIIPVTSAANVRRLGEVNVPSFSSNASSEAGTVGSAGIGGSPSSQDGCEHLRCFFLYPGKSALFTANHPSRRTSQT